MAFDRERMDVKVQRYLRSPQGASVLDEFVTGPAVMVIAGVFGLVAGLICLPTIVWTKKGLQTLWYTLTLKFIRDDQSLKLRRDPSPLRTLIAANMIIGPDRRHGLVLGTFDPVVERDLEFLARKAREFSELYAHGSTRPEDQAMLTLLRDDTYHFYRRRRVPEPEAEQKELYLFDVEIDLAQVGTVAEDEHFTAFVVQPGEKGQMVQIPWNLIKEAI